MGGFYPPKICKTWVPFCSPPQKKIPKHGSNLLKVGGKKYGKIFGKWVLVWVRACKIAQQTWVVFFCLQKCLKLNNLMYISLHWKCCFCIKKHKSFRGLRPLDPTRGLCPWTHRGSSVGPWTPCRKARARWALQFFCTVCKNLINGAPSHPLPSGGLRHPQAKLRHWVNKPIGT